MTKTKTERLITALRKGEDFTSRQLASRFRMANPSAHIHYLRTLGYPISLVERRKDDGERISVYKLANRRRA